MGAQKESRLSPRLMSSCPVPSQEVKILVFETNLMWSSKVLQSLKALGHEAILTKDLPSPELKADAAIVNLGQPSPDPSELVRTLKELGIPVIAHAGHKETALHQQGKDLAVAVMATNSELTFKMENLLQRIAPGS